MINDTGTDERRINFFLIDNSVVDDLNLSPYTGWLYVTIVRHINQETKIAFPSITTLAKKSGMSRPAVITHLDKLTSVGLIAIEKTTKDHGGNGVNHYKLLPTPSKAGLPPLVNEVNPNNTNSKKTVNTDTVPAKPEHARASREAIPPANDVQSQLVMHYVDSPPNPMPENYTIKALRWSYGKSSDEHVYYCMCGSANVSQADDSFECLDCRERYGILGNSLGKNPSIAQLLAMQQPESYRCDSSLQPLQTCNSLDDSNDVFANKNESGDSVPIMDDIISGNCSKCATLLVYCDDDHSYSCPTCTPPVMPQQAPSKLPAMSPDNPTDNPNLSQVEHGILDIANRPTTIRISVKPFASLSKHLFKLVGIGYLKQYKHYKRSFIITEKAKQWLADNPVDTILAIDGLEVHTEIPKKKPKRKYDRKLESLSSDVIPIAEALANCRHGCSYNDVLNGRREGIKKIAEKMRDDGLTGADVEIIQAYFEHRAKEQPDGANVWLKCNYDTYYKHAQDALDWKKKAPEKANDGIRLAHIVGDDDDY